MANKRRRVLIIRNSALGDVAMTLPVVYSAARQHPDTEFYMLTRPFFAKIFINPPSNLKVITADFKKEYAGLGGVRRLLGKLKRYGFTDVADLHNVLRSWLIDGYMMLTGKRVAMVSKHRLGRLARKITRRSDKSFFERYADTFGRLGIPVEVDFASLFGTDEDNGRDAKAVGIAPFARYYNKTYPPELMERVVELLSSEGYRVNLFGARGEEEELLQLWAKRYPGCVVVAGRHTIEEELELMARMAVMVTMDSANHHLASLVGTPVISIWGSTTPACGFVGYGQLAENTVCLNLDCQPCTTAGSPTCPKGHFRCMRDITPESIIEKIKQIAG